MGLMRGMGVLYFTHWVEDEVKKEEKDVDEEMMYTPGAEKRENETGIQMDFFPLPTAVHN